jgi:acyl-CoA synthetase (NDP forming)
MSSREGKKQEPREYEECQSIFLKAKAEGRNFLLEPEVYQIFKAIGLLTPAHFFLPLGEDVTLDQLATISSARVVVKVVSPQIIHKSDVGGVQVVANNQEEVARVITQMEKEVRARVKIDGSLEIKGFLISEFVDYENVGLGSELICGVRLSREFGPVIHFGLGGMDVEFVHQLLTPESAGITALASEAEPVYFRKRLESHLIGQKLCRPFRGRQPLLAVTDLVEKLVNLSQLSSYFSPWNKETDFTLEEIEANPLVVSRHRLIALDGVCRFSSCRWRRMSPPAEAIEFLLHPRRIGLIGVSRGMNIGRIILRNIIKAGYPQERVVVIKPGMESIDGCQCFPHLAALPQPVDLLIVALPAEETPSVLEEVVDARKAKAVILISGGMGEKKGTEFIEQRIKELIENCRQKGKFAPVINGGNCLGVFSKPARFDTTFVPAHKIFPAPRFAPLQVPLAYISQSGAFMISRMSNLSFLQPVYGISVGNQLDLTVGDYLKYFEGREEVRVLAFYIEGFKEGDGWQFVQSVRRYLAQKKRVVIVYKGGRSASGQQATSSHTASIAGDYHVFQEVMKSEGVVMAESLREFEQLIEGFCLLEGKEAGGRRIALISNAGFESVAMADLFPDEGGELAVFSATTVGLLRKIFTEAGVAHLQDIHNPLDLTPLADDQVFARVVETVLADEGVDAVVVSPVPMTTALQTLPSSGEHSEDFRREGSLARRLVELFRQTTKPIVINLDAGELYQPLVDFFQAEGLPVFRKADEATRFLQRYLSFWLNKQKRVPGKR